MHSDQTLSYGSADSSGAAGKSRRARSHHASSILFLFLLFAALVLTGELLICMGTGVYEDILSSMNENDSARTAAAYVRQKIRQGNDLDAVRTDELDGCEAIVLQQYLGEQLYETYLYCSGGELRELMIRKDAGTSFSADAGTPIASLDALSAEQDAGSGMLHVTLTIDDRVQELWCSTLTAQ